MTRAATPLLLALAMGVSASDAGAARDVADELEMSQLVDVVLGSLPAVDEETRYTSLTDADFEKVAAELGVEVAAIKAVARIEAGEAMKGFWAPGVPVANFSQALFSKYKSKGSGRKVKDGKVPSGLKGYALKEWTALVDARKTNADAADMGTYWGMFQIGGAHYKMCGCKTVADMVELMSHSELMQLELFARFIKASGMLPSLREKDWKTFARKYNGPAYAKRRYHTRMAAEYEKYKKKERNK